jgi:hypothetical protein
MTSETRHFIELNDILGIELACDKCGTRLSTTMEQSDVAKSIEQCHGRHQEWLQLSNLERSFVHRFLREIDSLSSSLKGRAFKLKNSNQPS